MEKINPLKNYDAPNFPTLKNARENRAMLKKIPSRWQKKTAIMACAGFFGLVALAGCAQHVSFASTGDFHPHVELHHGGAGGFVPFYVTQPTEEEIRARLETAAEVYADFRAQLETSELNLHAHYGGSGAGPFYVVRFTEQEAFGFMRAMMEAAGLHFNAAPPDYSVEVEDWFTGGGFSFGLDLFDLERNVAITNVNLDGTRMLDFNQIAEAFAKQHSDITVGVFRNPGTTVMDWSEHMEIFSHGWWGNENYGAERDEIIAPRTDEARQNLIASLTAQTQQFIDFLHSEGILMPLNNNASNLEISVTLNGTPMEFDVAPIIVNGRTLIPMRAIFEALGMEIRWHAATQTITATNDEIFKEIRMRIGDTEMIIGENESEWAVELEVPPQIVYGRTMVPIRAIAEATGANVEWDAATQTIRIIS